MCLILAAWRAHPGYSLVVAANRDEFHARRAASAGFWPDAPRVLAGRDLEGGGTWLGVTTGGRFAALTNYRDPARVIAGAPSRGDIVRRFLAGAESPEAFRAWLDRVAHRYNGFNLLFGDARSLHGYTNCGDPPGELPPGIYGLSNHLLDTPWPKVAQGKSRLAQALDALPDDGPLMELLRDDRIAADDRLPRTGVSLEWERLLSAAFIRSPTYGTRSSTVLLIAGREARFDEATYDPAGRETGRCRVAVTLDPPQPVPAAS
jgi:uncharacterized protein with NRDE domain